MSDQEDDIDNNEEEIEDEQNEGVVENEKKADVGEEEAKEEEEKNENEEEEEEEEACFLNFSLNMKGSWRKIIFQKPPDVLLTEDMIPEMLLLLCKTGNGLSHAYVRLEGSGK